MDERGYGLVDAALFLVFVSVSAAILAPGIVGHLQEEAILTEYRTEESRVALTGLLGARVDSTSYRLAGSQLDSAATAVGVNTSGGVYQTATRYVAGRECQHKTIADLLAENVASQLTLEYEGAEYRLNPLTREYDDTARRAIHEYMHGRFQGRYDYHLTAHWEPIQGGPLHGTLEVGDGPPPNRDVRVETVEIASPYTTSLDREEVERITEKHLDEITVAVREYGRATSPYYHNETVLQARVQGAMLGATGSVVNETGVEVANKVLLSAFRKTGGGTGMLVYTQMSNQSIPYNLNPLNSENSTLHQNIMNTTGRTPEEKLQGFIAMIMWQHSAPTSGVNHTVDQIVEGVTSNDLTESGARRVALDHLAGIPRTSRVDVKLETWRARQ